MVKFTIYIVGLTHEKRKAVMDVRGRYISHKIPPAATMVGIDQLVQPELLVEIEAVANRFFLEKRSMTKKFVSPPVAAATLSGIDCDSYRCAG